MAKLLSQNEIDMLMNQYDDPEGGSGETKAITKELVIYDFRHPKLVSKEQMRSLRTLHESFAKALSMNFSNNLRSVVEVELDAIDQVVFSEFVQSIAMPSALYTFRIEEWDGEAVIELDSRFCIFAFERQSGSNSQEMKYRRELTKIEENILKHTMNRVFKELKAAWGTYTEINIPSFSYTSDPDSIRLISAVEPAIVVFYHIEVGGAKATFNLCYPYSLLQEVLNTSVLRLQKSNSDFGADPEERKDYQRLLKKVPVPIASELGNTTISLTDLMKIKIGDVIALTQRTDQPLNVRVNNSTKFKAYPGKHRKFSAVKIYDFLNPDE
jgi:flagellar motor switch protein FliM